MSTTTEQIAAGEKEIALEVGSVRIPLVRIRSGEFDMGSPRSEKGHSDVQGPVRRVRITRPFYLGKYQITQAEYEAVMGTNPGRVKGPTLAVDQVTYAKALAFCQRLSKQTGIAVTLPTEAQWEYACRAGTQTRFYSGDAEEDLQRVAWYRDNAGEGVHPVGQKEPNAFGLFDMLGNVWEPCLDFIPTYETMPAENPLGTRSASEGAMRGGGWMYPADSCTAATRMWTNDMFGGTGVRIAINLP